MSFEYECNPNIIEQQSFRQIRSLIDLQDFSRDQQQVVMRLVHSMGMPEIAAQVRFSQCACGAGRTALAEDAPILCDVEMVRQGISNKMMSRQPVCYLNDPRVPEIAAQKGETRTMAALELWRDLLCGSVVIIGNAPTALFRLLEMLEQGAGNPALIIGAPVGFVGAAESKQALWEVHQRLGVECITVLGRQGGSAAAAAACNALLHCNRGQWY